MPMHEVRGDIFQAEDSVDGGAQHFQTIQQALQSHLNQFAGLHHLNVKDALENQGDIVIIDKRLSIKTFEDERKQEVRATYHESDMLDAKLMGRNSKYPQAGVSATYTIDPPIAGQPTEINVFVTTAPEGPF